MRLASSKPSIQKIVPRAAIAGGEVTIRGKGLMADGNFRPLVRFGKLNGTVLFSTACQLLVRVPEGVVSGEVTVESSAASASAAITIGATVAENLHPVANPAVDKAGNIFTTFSGSRGQKVPVSVYLIDREYKVKPFINDLVNPTGLAFDRDGMLYISSRMEGTVYKISPDGQRSLFADGMGVATGLAFDAAGNLYVGDRSGTIFKISPSQETFVFATLEPSVAAYHLAFGPDGYLYVTGPTTSSYDHVYRISPGGEVSTHFRGLGRPQGLAFDADGNLYVAGSLSGRRGIIRLSGGGEPELFVSGPGIVGLAFTPQRSLIVVTNSAAFELPVEIAGRPLPG